MVSAEISWPTVELLVSTRSDALCHGDHFVTLADSEGDVDGDDLVNGDCDVVLGDAFKALARRP